MNIIIICELIGFPYGYAGTNYVHLMSKGLVDTGANVHLLVLPVTETQNKFRNKRVYGNIDGITWEYTAGRTIRPSNPILLNMFRLKSVVVSCKRLFEKKRNKKIDVIIFYGHNIFAIWLFNLLSKYLNITFVTHIVEWPKEIQQKNFIKKIKAYVYCSKVFNLSNATIVISQYLHKLSKDNHTNSFMMPILVDPGAWEGIEPARLDDPYILYCASLDGYLKDALFVIEAFSKIKDDINLVMVGKASSTTKKSLESCAQALGLNSRLLLHTDYLAANDLKRFFAGANALLAPLHNDIRSIARFPSKIGDYLMSGRPVVTSAFGEVDNYLEDRENAFLCKTDKIEDFSKKITEAIQYNQLIGNKGRALAINAFDYRVNAQKLYSFLEQYI